MVFVLLLTFSQTSQERVCKNVYGTLTLCLKKHCCGEPGRVSCRDSCGLVECSSDAACGDGCCEFGMCTSRGCDTTTTSKTPWYDFAIPFIVFALILLLAMFRILWVKSHQVNATHTGMPSIYMNKTLMWKLGLKARFCFQSVHFKARIFIMNDILKSVKISENQIAINV